MIFKIDFSSSNSAPEFFAISIGFFPSRRFLKNKDEKQVIEVFKSLDAKFIDSKADLSAVFYIYPYYPVTISIWFEDEEFPPTGKMFLDKTADHYLTIEDAVGVGELMIKIINERYKKLFCKK